MSLSSDTDEVEKYVTFTKTLYQKTIGIYSITQYKPHTTNATRASTTTFVINATKTKLRHLDTWFLTNHFTRSGALLAFNVPHLYQLLTDSYPHLHVFSIEGWFQSYHVYLNDTASVTSWLNVKSIKIEDYECKSLYKQF
jgi:hypothetical protein